MILFFFEHNPSVLPRNTSLDMSSENLVDAWWATATYLLLAGVAFRSLLGAPMNPHERSTMYVAMTSYSAFLEPGVHDGKNDDGVMNKKYAITKPKQR